MNTQKVVVWVAVLVQVVLMLAPEVAFAQGAGAVTQKIDEANDNILVPIGLSIAGAGAVGTLIAWGFEVASWQTAAKWGLIAILIGLVTALIPMLAA